MNLSDVMPAGARLRGAVEQRYQRWLREIGQRQNDATARLEADLKKLVAEYIRDTSVAEFVAWALLVALVQDHSVQRMYTPTVVGVKFTRGRKVGTPGPVRAWLRKYMAKHPSATTAEAWAAIGRRPPKGCTVHENRLGKYIEGADNKSTGYRQFGNLVSEERPRK